MNRFKILFTDTIHGDLEIEREIVEKAGGEFYFGGDKSENEFFKLVGEADVIVTAYRNIDENILIKAVKCKGIVRTGIGFNNIDIKKAGELGKYVANVPDYCFDEVSDHTVLTALAVGRRVLELDRKVKAGDWSIDNIETINTFRGQKFGLLGFGNIPRYVSEKVRVFGFDVIAYDPFIKPEIAKEYGVDLVGLDKLLEESDYVSLHAPLTEETKHIINEKSIDKMKDGVIIVNTSRGGLIDEDALYNALKKGKVAGAALDVMEKEPPSLDNPIFNLDNVIITPHVAFYSEKSVIELRVKSFEEAVRMAKGNEPKNWVNKKYFIGK